MSQRSPFESQLKVDIEKLRQGPLQLTVRHQCRVFELADEQYTFVDPVEGELTFMYVRGDVFVRGRLRVMTRAVCVASLEEFDYACEAGVELVFVAEEKLTTRRKNEDDPERHMIHSFSGDVLRPAEALRECLMVELPVYPRRPEGADGLIRQFGLAGDKAAFEAEEAGDAKRATPRKPGRGAARPGGKDAAGAEEWKNRLRDLKDMPDIS